MSPRLEIGGVNTLQPTPLTRFWHRRISEAAIFVALIVLGLYGLSVFAPDTAVASVFPVSVISAVIAGFTFLASLALYFTTPSQRSGWITFLAYALLVATIASAVMTTGESNSPLIGLWIAAGVFAGVFGWRGYVYIILLIGVYDGYSYVTSPSSIDALIISTLATIAPLIASFIIWHTKSDKDTNRDKAYKELASELSHESNKSDTVINAINDGVVSVDSQGVIQLINPAAQRIIGWGQDDAVGLSYKSVVKLNNPDDKPIQPAEDPVAIVLATNKEVHSEDFSVMTEAGKKVLLSLIVSPIGTPSVGAIMVFRDMTKEKAEEREQAEFISTASHEMRTPVASIEGYLGLALNPATATIDEKARDYIQKAQASAQHLGRLFQDLLDVSKAEDGRMTNNPSVVDVTQFVGTVVEGLKPKADAKGIRFIYKPLMGADDSERTIAPVYYTHVDNDHLREVVSNLVDNAIKYTLSGDVIVDVGGDDTHVAINIQDSGIGIPTEDIPHLFQKFYRVDNSDTREIGGTGLGLYLSRRLCELMGGQIKVESEYKKGSTFTVELPRIDHSEAQRLVEASAAAKELASEGQIRSYAQVAMPDQQVDPLLESAPQPVMPPTHLPPQAQAQPQSQPLTQPPIQTQSIQPVTVAPPPAPVQPIPANYQQAPNIPLSQLEQNPNAYVSRRPSMQIPVRDQSDNPQA